MCEVVWLQFHPGILQPRKPPEFAPAVIRQFLLRLKGWEGCQEVFWGRDMDDMDAAAIIFSK